MVALLTVLAYSQEAATDLRPDPRTTDDAIDSRQNTDDNPASGNPTETAVDEGKTMVLGMTLFEDDAAGRSWRRSPRHRPLGTQASGRATRSWSCMRLKPTSFPEVERGRSPPAA